MFGLTQFRNKLCQEGATPAMTMQTGLAMLAILNAFETLRERLPRLVGRELANASLAPLDDGISAAWERIDAAIAGRAASGEEGRGAKACACNRPPPPTNDCIASL